MPDKVDDEVRNAVKQYLAEAIGTFCLVFAGTGAIVVNDVSGGAVTHVGISLTFGFVVTAMIYALGDLSGAHLNPAVTLGFWVTRRIEGWRAVFYCLSQSVGALIASLILKLLFPAHPSFGATLPKFGAGTAFAFEVVLTFILMFVIINVATGVKEKGIMAGLAIGGTVAVDALFGGPVSGASMNPARSLGPAVASQSFDYLWIYFLAPAVGSLAAILAWKVIAVRQKI